MRESWPRRSNLQVWCAASDYASNVELAKKRAVAVRDELVKLGVESKRIQLVPPVTVTGADSDDQARRVDLSVNQ